MENNKQVTLRNSLADRIFSRSASLQDQAVREAAWNLKLASRESQPLLKIRILDGREK